MEGHTFVGIFDEEKGQTENRQYFEKNLHRAQRQRFWRFQRHDENNLHEEALLIFQNIEEFLFDSAFLGIVILLENSSTHMHKLCIVEGKVEHLARHN